MKTKNFDTTLDLLYCRHCGQGDVDANALAKLQVIRDAYGKPMVITSAYRCPDHPSERIKSEPGSHSKGVAFDVQCNNGFDRATLVSLAIEYGACGIGVDRNFVHIDFDETREALTMWSY